MGTNHCEYVSWFKIFICKSSHLTQKTHVSTFKNELYFDIVYIHKNMMLMAQTYHQFTFELPVNETSAMRVSFAIASPIAAPPQKEVNIARGKLFFSKTSATSFVTAIVTNGVVGAPFLTCIAW